MPRDGRQGWTRQIITINAPVAAGTSAEEYLTDYVAGFHYFIESVKAVIQVAGAGAGATRVFRVIKGTATVVASATLTLAGTATKGLVIDVPVTAANAEFLDGDLLSLDVTGAGTSFTSLTFQWVIKLRQRQQQQ